MLSLAHFLVLGAILFAIGLFGASMLAAGVLPLATAYSISEAFGFEKGVSSTFREAPIFLGVFTFLVVLGATVAMMPAARPGHAHGGAVAPVLRPCRACARRSMRSSQW